MKQVANPAVIMCTWRRIDRLPITLAQLAAQKGSAPHLYIWNNNPDARAEVDRYVANAPAGLQVQVHHSPSNIGGFGRFHYAKKLAAHYPYVIFIDDDQEFETDTIQTLAREFKPRTIKGQHAFNFITPRSYWLRLPAGRGKPATYIGTCGMVADSQIFTHDILFDCPPEYRFIEDLWLCYVAEHHLGWRLRRSHVRMRFVIDTKNQFHGLMAQKTAFLRYLTNRGWRVEGRAWQL